MIKLIRKIIHDIMMIIMPKSVQKSLLSCKEVARILTEEHDSLSTVKIIKLKMHIMICQSCTDYKKQISIIEKNSKKLPQIYLDQETLEKVNKSKDDILKRLKSS